MFRLAFVSGANGSPEFSPLKYAVTDADAIAGALASPRCRFQVKRPPPHANPYQFREALDEAAVRCSAEDTFLCYFAGHGVLEGGELFLVLNHTTSNFQTTALPAEDVLASMRRCKARDKLLILDCCHAGGVVRYRAATLPVNELEIASAHHLVLMASGRLEKVREYEHLGGGFLARRVCDALGEQFHEADRDGDLKLTIDELMDFLEQSAAWHNRIYPKAQVPIPYLFGEKKGDFYFTPKELSWQPYEVAWPEGTTMVVLPIPPIHPGRGYAGERGRRWLQDWGIESPEPSASGYALAIGKHPVTNQQYRRFLESGGARTAWPETDRFKHLRRRRRAQKLLPEEPCGEDFVHQVRRWIGPFFPWRDDRFKDPLKPVVCVSYDEALSYARWAHERASSELKGTFTNVVPHRLWEFAAFGTQYPSGDPKGWRSDLTRLHHNASGPGVIDTEGQRSNERGVTDLFGNVWEWCGSMNGFLQRAGFPFAMAVEEEICLRGGGFLDDLSRIKPFLSRREIPDEEESRHSDHGFRIAAMIPCGMLPKETRLLIELHPQIDIAEEIAEPPLLEGTDF